MSVVGGSWDHDYDDPILELVPLVAGCSTFANDFDLILDDDLTVAVEVKKVSESLWRRNYSSDCIAR